MQQVSQQDATVDITPHPRILKMLGEIAFEPHKCIGELIDNSIDAFLNGPSIEYPKIEITVPHRQELEANRGQVMLEDNGPGMTLETLRNAASAGFSGNLPVENLGLFGMGFNIATARLGRITQLRSGVVGENAWSILEINLDALQRQRTFKIAPRFESKRPNEHGTRVTIMNLRFEQAMQVAAGIPGGTLRSSAGLRNWIGRTYARYLREPVQKLGDNRLSIILNGRAAEPYRWCIWGEERYVEIGSATRAGAVERISAFREFDQHLGSGNFCTSCLSWMPTDYDHPTNCMFCDDSSLIHRERRMKGWVGIQRHLDDDEFGFDFLRNGRAILQWDRRVFTWLDPSTGRSEIEYPIDELRARHGRIVGEVEVDHVPVHYQKDSFEEDSPLWHEVINNLRGQSPLRPTVASRRGLLTNDSLLADVYRGFNRTRREERGRARGAQNTRRSPWNQDLIINQDVAKDYYRRFLAGDEEYQSDKMWYEWMQAADREREQAQHPTQDDDQPPDIITGQPASEPPPPSELEILKQSSELDEVLSGSYGFQPMREIAVNVYKSTEHLREAEQPARGNVAAVYLRVPLKVFPAPDGTMDCFYDTSHSGIAEDDGQEVAELVISEASLAIQRRYYDRLPYSYVFARVRASRRDDSRPRSVPNLAQRLIEELIPPMISAYANGDNERIKTLKNFLSTDEHVRLGLSIAESGGSQSELEEILDSGKFLRWTPQVLGKLLRASPELFLDELVFSPPYNNVPTGLPDLRRKEIGMGNANKVASMIEDVANVSASQGFESAELQRLSRMRATVSHDYLREILVAT